MSHAENSPAHEAGTTPERLRLIADAAPLLIGYLDTDRRYRFNNRAYADWFGLTREELYGRHIAEVIGDDAYKTIRQHLDAAFSNRTVSYDRSLSYKDGVVRHVHTTLVPDADEQGRVRGLVLFVSDTTQLQQAQADLLAAFNRVLLINEIGRAARSASLPDAILRSTIAALGQAMGADRCYYVSYDLAHDHGTLGPEWYREGVSPVAGEYRLSDYAPNRNAAYLRGETDVVEDAFALPDNPLAVRLGLRSLVRVPLQREGAMTALVVAMAHTARAWTPDEIALVETVAAQTRAAVEAARHAGWERALLQDVLASVTEGKLLLSTAPSQLPAPLVPTGDPISLTPVQGLRALRRRAQEAAHAAGHPEERQYDLMTGASEAGMNAVVHGGGGTAWVSADAAGTVQVRVEDHGAGIAVEDLPRAALARGFSTKATLGHGIKMMLETVDRMHLLTGPGGTTVVIEQQRTTPLPPWLADALG